MNHFLGNGYTVTHFEKSKDEFLRDFRMHFEKEFESALGDDADVFAFVVNENGSYVQPLYKKQENYIMGVEGKTISTLKP